MTSDEIDRDLIWKRLEEIRQHDTEPEKLKTLLEAWDQDFGPEYNDIVSEVLAERLKRRAAAWAREHGIVTAEDIVKDMWEGWEDGEFTIERREDGIQIYCTKCPHADAYRAIGRVEQGLLFKCCEDPPIVEGINPEVEFRRTKSLMAGDDCCDHFYSNKK
jgi:hypothetical protein